MKILRCSESCVNLGIFFKNIISRFGSDQNYFKRSFKKPAVICLKKRIVRFSQFALPQDMAKSGKVSQNSFTDYRNSALTYSHAIYWQYPSTKT